MLFTQHCSSYLRATSAYKPTCFMFNFWWLLFTMAHIKTMHKHYSSKSNYSSTVASSGMCITICTQLGRHVGIDTTRGNRSKPSLQFHYKRLPIQLNITSQETWLSRVICKYHEFLWEIASNITTLCKKNFKTHYIIINSMTRNKIIPSNTVQIVSINK